MTAFDSSSVYTFLLAFAVVVGLFYPFFTTDVETKKE
jgi:hypothetical protein